MKDMKNILNGVIGVAVAREIVALQGTDHPRDFPPTHWGLAQLVRAPL